jgi:branched-chain amino acid aminotransferase
MTDDVTPAVWVNGERLPVEGMHVSARDRGFTLADGVFETMRVRNGRVFRLDDHLTRLSGALRALEIPEPSSLREWLLRAARTAASEDTSVRLTVTRGPTAIAGVAPQPACSPTAIVSVAPLPQFPAAVYERGLSAHIASGRRNERAMTAGLKTLAYTDAVVAMIEARQAEADEVLFLDTAGHCSEASSSNLFVWTGDTLVTPPVTCAALPGITRALVLELARAQGMSAEERICEPAELHAAAEAFLTSSLRGIAPLVRVDGRAIGAGTPGEVTRRLRAAYLAFFAEECRG